MTGRPLPGRASSGGEDGIALILALALITLLGVFATAVLTVGYAEFKTTGTTRAADSRQYAADGGLDIAIQALRTSTSYCGNVSGSPQGLPSTALNGRTITATCQTLSGTTGGQQTGPLGPWSIVVTGYPDPDSTAPINLDAAWKAHGSSTSGALPLTVNGDVFNAGNFSLANYPPGVKFTGNVHQYNDAPDTYCSGDKATASSTGWPQVSGTWSCDLKANYPVPDPNPTLIVPAATAHAPVVQGSCTILFPGRYTSAFAFDKAKRYYLASGVYYLDGVGDMKWKGEIFGGQPGPNESQTVTSDTPCSNDAAANALVPGSATGYGVEIVLGGNSKFHITNDTENTMEFFSRVPAVPASEGTAGLSVYAPAVSGSNWTRWKTDKVLDMDGPDVTAVVFHGLWYAPRGPAKDAYALANAAAGGASLFSGGAVFQTMELDFKAASVGAVVAGAPPTTPATTRTTVVTATAAGSGEASVTVQAVVQLPATAGGAPTILSWRKA